MQHLRDQAHGNDFYLRASDYSFLPFHILDEIVLYEFQVLHIMSYIGFEL